jgi:integrase
VFAATTTLGGAFGSKYATETINDIASKAVGRRLTVQDMRRWAVRRQFLRGVPTAVIAKWLGHTNDRYVRQTLRLLDPVSLVSQADVIAQIKVEPDGDRFGRVQHLTRLFRDFDKKPHYGKECCC